MATHHDYLTAMGIQQWVPRQAPLGGDIPCQIDRLRVGAHCWVVVVSDAATLEAEQSKLLAGMLGVLELAPELQVICHVQMQAPLATPTCGHLLQQIASFIPHACLILDTQSPWPAANIACFQTHSPAHLQRNPADKRAAYHTLLSLKQQLARWR